MKTVKFKSSCNFQGKTYYPGDELKNITKEDLVAVWKLNEKGLIEPLNEKELRELVEKPIIAKKIKNEEE